ncbi:MAG: hypothetical protein HC904_07280 [Blastochloris sp.]|nr:hypothetical protein [Blastochloris sp.]
MFSDRFVILERISLILLFFVSFSGLQAAEPLEIKNNQIVVLKIPAAAPKIISAAQVEIQELVLVTVDLEGKRSAWQKSFLVGMVDAFVPEASKWETSRIEAVLTAYQKLATQVPEAKTALSLEEFKWKKVLDSQRELDLERQKKEQQALMQATSQPFDAAKDYKVEEINQAMAVALKMAQENPSLTSSIQDYLKPWQERLQLLQEGKRRFEGAWKTAAEIQSIQDQRSKEEEARYFAEKGHFSISALVVPHQSMLIALGVAAFTLLSILFSFFRLAMAKGGMSFGGVMTLLIGLGILGLYAYFGYNLFQGPTTLGNYWPEAYKTEVEEAQVPNPLPRMMFMASGSNNRRPRPEDAKITFQDSQINLLTKSLLTMQAPATEGSLNVVRKALAIRFHGDKIEFIDEVQFLGRDWLLRYDMLYRKEGDSFTIYNQEIFAGDARLPGMMGSYVFRQFYKELLSVLKDSNLGQLYSIEQIEPGSMTVIWPLTQPQSKPPK